MEGESTADPSDAVIRRPRCWLTFSSACAVGHGISPAVLERFSADGDPSRQVYEYSVPETRVRALDSVSSPDSPIVRRDHYGADPDCASFSIRYFHYYGPVFPLRFLPDVFYKMPHLEHFLSQAGADSIPDGDIDESKPRPKLLTLEIDPGVHDGNGQYRDARVDKWADLEQLRSLALVGLEAIANILPTNGTSFPHLQEVRPSSRTQPTGLDQTDRLES
jgi:hypothetical protein